MNKWAKTSFLLIVVVFSAALLTFWVGNTTSPPKTENTAQSNSQPMEGLATEYADKNSSLEQTLTDIDSLAQSSNLTSDEVEWLKARVTELRNAASLEELPQQPQTFEDYTQYFVDYNSQTLTDVRTFQKLYDQYVKNPGSDAPITQSTLQALNQAKFKETINLVNIDEEINQLMINGTLTTVQGASLRERVYQLRSP